MIMCLVCMLIHHLFIYIGYDVIDLLPSIDDLVSSHYLVQEGLSENSTFLFLMKAGYEHLERIADVSFDDTSHSS